MKTNWCIVKINENFIESYYDCCFTKHYLTSSVTNMIWKTWALQFNSRHSTTLLIKSNWTRDRKKRFHSTALIELSHVASYFFNWQLGSVNKIGKWNDPSIVSRLKRNKKEPFEVFLKAAKQYNKQKIAYKRQKLEK